MYQLSALGRWLAYGDGNVHRDKEYSNGSSATPTKDPLKLRENVYLVSFVDAFY
jgi:hypothetical protein